MSASRAFPRRFLSLWMPFLPTDRIRRQRGRVPLDRDVPLVLVASAEGTRRIMAADRTALACGLHPGMALAQARAMVPGLSALPYDATADTHLLQSIADWADRYTPLVGRDPPSGLLLDITGAAHLFGGEHALAVDLANRLARAGITAVPAIAPTVGAAWALSRSAHSKGAANVIVAEDVTRSALDAVLAPLPIATLRLPDATTVALRRVGLKRIGDLIGRPRCALVARFGASPILRLDQARGIDTESINPRQPVPSAVVEHSFVEPVLATAAIEQACHLLSGRLSEMLESRGQGATALELAVYRVDGCVKRINVRLAMPCRASKTMASLLILRLNHLDDPLDPGFGYDLVRLSATALAAKDTQSLSFSGLDEQSIGISLADACAPLVDRLAARFGAEAIHTVHLADTHSPELAARQVSISSPPSSHRRRAGTQPISGAFSGDQRLRPLRMFDPPEPVEVMAEVPDGPPIHLRWRRRPVRIAWAEGPERIAPEWWRMATLARPLTETSATEASVAEIPRDQTRDYWRIEDAIGRRLWLYREGFYGPPSQTERSRPHWFIHGLFA